MKRKIAVTDHRVHLQLLLIMDEPLSAEEQAMYEQALKDPVIRAKFEEQMRQMYPGQNFELPGSKGVGTDLRSEKITPEPAFVVKTRALESNDKVFINFCKSPRIKTLSREPQAPTPEDPDPPERIRIPLSLGSAEQELDKNGETCTVYDVVMNPEVIDGCTGNSDFRSWVVDVAMSWIENKSGGGLDRSFTTPRIRNNYKGSAIREQYIRSSLLIEEVPETRSFGGGGNTPALPPSKISGASAAAASNYGKNSYGDFKYTTQLPACYAPMGSADANSENDAGVRDAAAPTYELLLQRRVEGALTSVAYAAHIADDAATVGIIVRFSAPSASKASDCDCTYASESVTLSARGAPPVTVKLPLPVDDSQGEAVRSVTEHLLSLASNLDSSGLEEARSSACSHHAPSSRHRSCLREAQAKARRICWRWHCCPRGSIQSRSRYVICQSRCCCLDRAASFPACGCSSTAVSRHACACRQCLCPSLR